MILMAAGQVSPSTHIIPKHQSTSSSLMTRRPLHATSAGHVWASGRERPTPELPRASSLELAAGDELFVSSPWCSPFASPTRNGQPPVGGQPGRRRSVRTINLRSGRRLEHGQFGWFVPSHMAAADRHLSPGVPPDGAKSVSEKGAPEASSIEAGGSPTGDVAGQTADAGRDARLERRLLRFSGGVGAPPHVTTDLQRRRSEQSRAKPGPS